MTFLAFFDRDPQKRPLANISASGRLQHSDVQIGLPAVRQLDEAKTLADFEPQYLGVDRVRRHGRWALKIAWLRGPFRNGNGVVDMAMPAWLAMVSIFAHDHLDWLGWRTTLPSR